jgi:DNA-binding NtrC family response regulator
MAQHLKVLIIDDEPAVPHALGVLFDLHGIEVATALSPEEGVDAVRRGGVGVVLQDMNFREDKTSGEEGVRLFRTIRGIDRDVPVLLMTAWASLETAVQLIKEGANDYLAKPWDDEKLVITVRNLLKMRTLQLENRKLQRRNREAREALARANDLCGMVYESEELHRVTSLAINVATSDAPVLITGPSGAGKEKLAEIVHANSRRRDQPFLRVNVGALPEDLMEAELFGAEAGAYTGAKGLRIGMFETANGGTLFLDEIDALSLNGQVKLLRVAQSGEFQRLGSSATRRADVRLVSATNTDLAAAIRAGGFREDLFYRLNVIELAIPPLAGRPDDILPLARHFLVSAPSADRSEPPVLSPVAEQALLRHPWNGNVRELQNRIHRALLTYPGPLIEPGDLDLESSDSAPDVAPPVSSAAETAERQRIERALLEVGGVVSQAAEELGLSRQALYRKMEKLGIVLERRPRS